jgi:hypothetical protein
MRTFFGVACTWALLVQQAGFGQTIVVPDDNVSLSPFLDQYFLNVSLSPLLTAVGCEDPRCSYVGFDYENWISALSSR